jgi:hypothetical protein
MEPQRLIWNSLQRSQIVAFEISGEWTGRGVPMLELTDEPVAD